MITSPDGLSLLVLLLVGCFFAGGWVLTFWQLPGGSRSPGRRSSAALGVDGGPSLDRRAGASPAPTVASWWRWTLAGVNGLLIAGLGLTLSSAAGLVWTPALVWTLAIVCVLPAFFAWRLAWRPAWRLPRWPAVEETRPLSVASWLLAAGVILLFAAMAAWRMNVHADYVYHWGQKAAKNYLAGGLDVAFLAQPWNAYVHPDYPNLLPALHAAAFAASGGIGWPATAALASAFFALLVVALLALSQASGGSRWGRFAAFGMAALGASAFAIGYRQAGGADIAMAAAVTAAAVALVRPASLRSRGDLQVAVVAALLAAVKLEGLPAAALLIALHALRSALSETTGRLRRAVLSALRSTGPVLVVAGLWAWTTFRHGLFLQSNTGDFQLSRLPEVGLGLLRVALLPDWWGLPLALAALPLLALLDRRQRFAALFLIAQLAFYFYSYAAGPVDTGHWIETSAARLLFHLVPAALVMSVLWADRLSMAGSGASEPKTNR